MEAEARTLLLDGVVETDSSCTDLVLGEDTVVSITALF